MKARLAAYLKAHPWLAGMLVVVESSAIGAATDLLANGTSFQGNGTKHFLTVVGVGVATGVRNYLKQSPLVPDNKEIQQ